MSASENVHELVEVDLYQQSFLDIRQLKQSLPEATVVSLAREVLRRFSEQSATPVFEPDEVERLSIALIDADPDKAAQFIENQYDRGIKVQDFYLRLLSPAARMLGEWWDDDKVSFTQVTIGTGRIYAIMRSLRIRFEQTDLPVAKTAFFASVPDETHLLGVKMAADLFRQRGWQIDVEVGLDHDSLIARIISSRHRLIGVSAGGLHALPTLARLILALRVSVPGVRILVSGNIVAEATDSLRLMQPDAMTEDFDEAFAALERLWGVLNRG